MHGLQMWCISPTAHVASSCCTRTVSCCTMLCAFLTLSISLAMSPNGLPPPPCAHQARKRNQLACNPAALTLAARALKLGLNCVVGPLQGKGQHRTLSPPPNSALTCTGRLLAGAALRCTHGQALSWCAGPMQAHKTRT